MVARGFDLVCPGWDLGHLTSAAGRELGKARGGEEDGGGSGGGGGQLGGGGRGAVLVLVWG